MSAVAARAYVHLVIDALDAALVLNENYPEMIRPDVRFAVTEVAFLRRFPEAEAAADPEYGFSYPVELERL